MILFDALVTTILFLVTFYAILFIYVIVFNISAQKSYEEHRARGGKRDFIRTPEERFKDLPGYDFAPHYVEIDGLRVYYVDEGPSDSAPVLLMHGEPSWSYLYRKMIPPLVKAGHRVIAPDLIGFGKSDKLTRRKDYCYQMHVDTMSEFVKKIDLKNITLFCQDWGGLIGLRVVALNPDRFDRIIAANTALPGFPPRNVTRKASLLPLRSVIGFIVWLTYSQVAPKLSVSAVLQFGTVTKLPPEVLDAYEAPFPDWRYLAGARAFPTLAISQLKECSRAWEVFAKWEKPFLTAFADKDPVLGGGDKIFQEVIPGAKGMPHRTTTNASHFLQEDKGEELAELIIDFIKQDVKKA